MIIGLTGRNGSGKGTIADILKGRGYLYFSLSDMIREEIRHTGHDVTRERMIAMGRKLRQEGGAGVLADKVLNFLLPNKDYIIDSIRNPGEVHSLKKHKDFFLLSIEADQKVRFERCAIRARENDPMTLEEFIRLEEIELSSQNEASQQLIATEKLADAVVQNDETVVELERNLDLALQCLAK